MQGFGQMVGRHDVHDNSRHGTFDAGREWIAVFLYCTMIDNYFVTDDDNCNYCYYNCHDINQNRFNLKSQT